MRWLLLILILDVSNGGMRPVFQGTKSFATQAACDAEGEQMMESVDYPDENLRSVSICIPETAFNE